MASRKMQLRYFGHKGWLIFWLIVFFPVGICLLFTACEFEWNRIVYTIRYEGSRPWLCFWTVFFFPIAIILALLNGVTIDESNSLLSA